MQALLSLVTGFGPLDRPALGRDAPPDVRRMLQVGGCLRGGCGLGPCTRQLAAAAAIWKGGTAAMKCC